MHHQDGRMQAGAAHMLITLMAQYIAEAAHASAVPSASAAIAYPMSHVCRVQLAEQRGQSEDSRSSVLFEADSYSWDSDVLQTLATRQQAFKSALVGGVLRYAPCHSVGGERRERQAFLLSPSDTRREFDSTV